MSAVHVLYFGPAKDAAGAAEETMEIAAGTVLSRLTEEIFTRHARLAALRGVMRFAVNGEFSLPDRPLADGDEVAMIPPVSGGTADEEWIELTEFPIDVPRSRTCMGRDPTLGGVVTFEGATRAERNPERGRLMRLEYEAYGTMALAEMRRLAAEARRRWPIGRLTLIHRVGQVDPGEVSVLITVACPHRAEAFEACRWLIDTLKKEVPIWKREVWESGESTWVDPTRSEAGHGEKS